jgi:adenine-specific DNA-methyltransferase
MQSSANSTESEGGNSFQLSLWGDPVLEERQAFLSQQLITYIGNKRSLLNEIGRAILPVKERLAKKHLRIFDAFSGSGVVSRFFKQHSSYLVNNDLEDYAYVVSRCFLRNKSTINIKSIQGMVQNLNACVDKQDLPTGFIEELYAPRCENNISKNDRVFYTRRNARRLDNFRRMIDALPEDEKIMLLGPLISKASIHANTSGVFKGFHKDRNSKIGRFGGTNADALKRILGDIVLEVPILSRFECDVEVLQGDTNKIATEVKNIDLAYLDPPYNQHPYGSNYFMLNLLVTYKRPNKISEISGIPFDWRRSDYNVRSLAKNRFRELIESLDAKFILVSFNNEGFIAQPEMLSMLSKVGKVDVMDIMYNTFRGCRNINNRNIHVTEHLFIVEKK